jgi:hypothetical protein
LFSQIGNRDSVLVIRDEEAREPMIKAVSKVSDFQIKPLIQSPNADQNSSFFINDFSNRYFLDDKEISVDLIDMEDKIHP